MSLARYLSKLGALLNSSGQVPAAAIADATITAAKMAATFSSAYLDIGTIRIQWARGTTPASATSTSGYIVNYYADVTLTWPAAFKSGSEIYITSSFETDYHDAFLSGGLFSSSQGGSHNTTTVNIRCACARSGGVQSKYIYAIAIGEKP